MVDLIPQKAMNEKVSHLHEVNAAVKREAEAVADAAKAELAAVRATTHWHKIIGPDHLTWVDSSDGEVDAYATLHAPNAVAIEYGHSPSGFFAGTRTKSPEGLYILNRAAGYGLG